MGFVLDAHSRARLKGVHTDLVRVVEDCAAKGSMVFGVSEGLRTLDQQKKDVALGKSQTLDSRHLTGHAVDLVVLQNSKVTWAWPLYYALAVQMRDAAKGLNLPVIWGGCWDKELNALGDDMEVEAALYVTRARARGAKGFLDGPHYELPRSRFP